MTTEAAAIEKKGGSWLLEDTLSGDVFTPEQMTEEQKLIKQTVQEFVDNEVITSNAQLETKDWELARRLLRRCGELGLLGTDVPEEYGGVPLDKATSAIIASRFGHSGSFNSIFGAQTGLVILTITTFGTDYQKKKYLPKLVSGEWVGAYCLSESGSGSDALSAKASAIRQKDDSFVLNGEKMWVTNGGFADVYIVFAKLEGKLFTAFIVERSFEGVSSGAEEHKMGLLGSSTTPVLLENAKVPAKNVLGEIGKGHKVAFNALNYGRFKLGASTVGGTQEAIGDATHYSVERYQFSQPISNFGAIKHKLGEMTIRAYALESMVFRTAGLIDSSLKKLETSNDKALLITLEEYAIESSIVKVAGSETLHYVLDENVQIHGGNGFVKGYSAERLYRDSRVNRIFEGTNEINRLLITGMLVRRALTGSFPLIEAAKKIKDEIKASDTQSDSYDGPLMKQQLAILMFKKVSLTILGLALQKFGEKISDEQEILSFTADILIDTFAAESALLRALQAEHAGELSSELQAEAVRALVNDSAMRINSAAHSALAAIAKGDTLQTNLLILQRLLKISPVNVVAIRRRLANQTVKQAGYIF